jgi:hypothetical protein
MIIKGIKVKRSKTIGYRMANPETDRDTAGNPVPSNYVAFVKISDCKVEKKEGKNYYDPKDAPNIPVGYGGTYYGYGEDTLRRSERGVWINNKLCYEYYQYNVYFVQDGRVYMASRKARVETRKTYAKFEKITFPDVVVETIRKVPENYCLIAWDKDGNPQFDIDAATTEYRQVVKEAYDIWESQEIKKKEILATIVNNKLKELALSK